MSLHHFYIMLKALLVVTNIMLGMVKFTQIIGLKNWTYYEQNFVRQGLRAILHWDFAGHHQEVNSISPLDFELGEISISWTWKHVARENQAYYMKPVSSLLQKRHFQFFRIVLWISIWSYEMTSWDTKPVGLKLRSYELKKFKAYFQNVNLF